MSSTQGEGLTHVSSTQGAGLTHVSSTQEEQGLTHVSSTQGEGLTHVSSTQGEGLATVSSTQGEHVEERTDLEVYDTLRSDVKASDRSCTSKTMIVVLLFRSAMSGFSNN